jgi:hypothetical protein
MLYYTTILLTQAKEEQFHEKVKQSRHYKKQKMMIDAEQTRLKLSIIQNPFQCSYRAKGKMFHNNLRSMSAQLLG